jgi:orotidine-5'-phosphate decarboxylase
VIGRPITGAERPDEALRDIATTLEDWTSAAEQA